MGQKVNPNGIRLGIVKPWNSTWFANISPTILTVTSKYANS